jgi:hypothetical protein
VTGVKKKGKMTRDCTQLIPAGSLWLVPPSTLKAIQFTYNASPPFRAKSDQTLWAVESSSGRYFWGTSYTYLTDPAGTASPILSTKRFLASLAPDGSVLMTFLDPEDPLAPPVTGIGEFRSPSAQRPARFHMQMNTASNSAESLAHSSWMVRVEPGDRWYREVPGTPRWSVPQFLAQF